MVPSLPLPLPRPSSAVPPCVPLRLVSVREINARRAFRIDERARKGRTRSTMDTLSLPLFLYIKESRLAVDFTEFYLFALLHFWRDFLSDKPARGFKVLRLKIRKLCRRHMALFTRAKINIKCMRPMIEWERERERERKEGDTGFLFPRREVPTSFRTCEHTFKVLEEMFNPLRQGALLRQTAMLISLHTKDGLGMQSSLKWTIHINMCIRIVTRLVKKINYYKDYFCC